VSCRTNKELFIFRRTGPAGIKLIYQVKADATTYETGGDTIEIISTSGPYVDQSYIFVGKNNNADIQFYEVLIDELASEQELIFVHKDFKKKNLQSMGLSGAMNFGSDSTNTLVIYN